MKKINIVFGMILGMLVFSACDEIKGPYEEDAVVPPGDRKVLLEDFTGHQCGNCPTAAREAAKLDSVYEGRVIVVGTHVSFFADTNKTGKYTYNFKTEVGNQLDRDYEIENAGLPKGMINRKKYNNQYLLNYGDWSSALVNELKTAPDVNIAIGNAFDEGTRELTVQVDVQYVKRGKPNQYLVVYLVENSLVNWQKDYARPAGQQDIPNYVHHHVLRGTLNGNYGQQLSPTEILAGRTVRKTVKATLNPDYKAENCSVVAFVFEDNGIDANRKPNKPVLQAEEKKVIE